MKCFFAEMNIWTCGFLWMVACVAAQQKFDVLVKSQDLKDATCKVIVVEDMDSRVVDGNLETDIEVTLLKDLPDNTLICVRGEEKMNNGVYMDSTLSLPCVNLCELLKNDTCFYPILQDKSEGTLPDQRCPIRAGSYTVKRLRLQVPCLPDEIPGGEFWRFTVTIKSGDALCVYYETAVMVEFPKLDGPPGGAPPGAGATFGGGGAFGGKR